MDDELAAKLRKVRDRSRLTEAEERLRSGWYAPGPYACLECGKEVRKPRLLREAGGRRFVTLTWCSQECLSAWCGRFHLPGEHYEWLDAEGNLKGFYIPKRGYVPLEVLDREEA